MVTLASDASQRLAAIVQGERLALRQRARPGCALCRGRGYSKPHRQEGFLIPCLCTGVTRRQWRDVWIATLKKIGTHMPAVETVKIQDPKKKGDFLTINRDDFDPDKHKLFLEVEKAEGAGKGGK